MADRKEGVMSTRRQRWMAKPESIFILLLVFTQALCETPKYSEQEFMKWVKFVGNLNHSHFSTTKKKLLPSSTLVVDKDPAAGDFTTIQQAIDSLPFGNLVIKVNAGVYKEKVDIPKKKSFITIEGAGAETTVVQWGDMAQTIGANGQPLSTFGSATFAVNSHYFIAKNITFQNTTPVPEPPGAIGKQAVALRISADTAAFIGCVFLGAQDTLYDHKGRHYYAECYIEGSVDFIFGNGLSIFERCQVHGIAPARGAITAQRRSSWLENTGFSFVRCTVSGSGALYLGRAWGAFSKVVFSYTYMDNIIIPQGWYNWGDPNREMSVYYGEYQCTGPGAAFARRVPWSRHLTDEEAQPFLSLSFIEGFEWINL